MNTKDQIIEQIKLVLKTLKSKYKSSLDNGILESIFKRYVNALDILENNKDIEEVNIEGSVHAYLDAYSDYENPLLENMYKAEKLYKKLLMEKKSS